MSILVTYASKHGATAEIAERIAGILRAAGQHVDARPVRDAGGYLADYEGYVIGSAVYSTHWLKEATAYVKDNRCILAQRPVWLFSSGPLGAQTADGRGVDPTEAFEPTEIRGLQVAIHPRGHRIFSGAVDSQRFSTAESLCLKDSATRAILPEGDFRDWAQIEQWAADIAQELTPAGRPATRTSMAGVIRPGAPQCQN